MEAFRTLLRATSDAVVATGKSTVERLNRKNVWDRLALALFALAALLVLLTFRAYGVTWDEDCQNWYGNLILTYYLWLAGAAHAPHWELLYRYADMYNYGGLFDLAAAIVNGMRERRVLISATGPHGNVLKIRPPLPFAREHADQFLTALQETVEAVH